MDFFQLWKAIKEVWGKGDFWPECRAAAVEAYEDEMVRRGGEEVRLSEANRAAMHDWEKVTLSDSPIN